MLKSRHTGKNTRTIRKQVPTKAWLDALESRTLFSVATHLVFGVIPAGGTAGGTLSSITVKVEDALNNVVTTDTSTVTLAANTGPLGLIFNAVTAQAVNGVATFTGLSIPIAGNYTMIASDGLLLPAISGSLSILPGTPAQLAVTIQPGSSNAGSPGTISVSVEDLLGNVIPTDNSTVTISLGSGNGTLAGNLTAQAVNGVATFTNVLLNQAGNYTLRATDGLLTSALSNVFTILPGTPAKLVITSQPANDTAGTADTVTVAVEDQYGNIVPTASPVITLALGSGNGTLTGNLSQAAVNGVATFNNVVLNTVGNFTLQATSTSLTSVLSNLFTISPGTATKLVFGQAPTNGTAGLLSTTQVFVEDAYGNIVTNDNSLVTLATGNGTLAGNMTAQAVNGIATFSNLWLTQAGNYVLTATDGSLLAAITNPFTILHGTADQLVFIDQPDHSAAGENIQQIQVAVEDQYGNIVTDSTQNITLQMTNGNVALLGDLSQNAVNGIATFSQVAIHKAGNYTLTAIDDENDNLAVAPDVSDAFNITPGAATQWILTSQPTQTTAGATLQTLTLTLADAFGNLITTGNQSVTVSLGNSNATLGGTVTVNAVNGVATFSDLSLTKAGNYTLSFAGSSLTGVVTQAFTVVAAAPAKLAAIGTLPTTATAGTVIGPISIAVEDIYNNIISTAASNVTISAANGTLNGTLTAPTQNGIATFNDLTMNRAGTYTLAISQSGLTGLTQDVTITPGAVTQIVWGALPSRMLPGTLFDLTAYLEDAFGNIVTTANSNVTLSPSNGSPAPTGNLTTTAVNGIAIWHNLKFTKTGTPSLISRIGNITSAATAPLTIGAKLVFGQLPTTSAAGTTLGLTVMIEDAAGNILTNDNAPVTLSIATGPNGAPLGGTLTVNAVNGIATFADVNLQKVGTYTLRAIGDQLTSALSTKTTVTSGIAAGILYVQQPTNTLAGKTIAPVIKIEIIDAFGNIVTNNPTGKATLNVQSGPAGGQLVQTLFASVVRGIALFKTAAINLAGNYTLGTTFFSLFRESNAFIVAPNTPSQLIINGAPTTTTAGQTLDPVTVSIEDKYGNLINSSAPVTMTIKSGAKTIGQKVTVAAVNGIATFTGITLTQTGTDTLSFASQRAKTATTGNITVAPGAATQLAFVTQPKTAKKNAVLKPFTIAVKDAYGNLVTTDDSMITLSIATGPDGGTLGGTHTVPVIHGLATFTDITFDTVGSYSLQAVDADSDLAAASSIPFAITM